MHRAEKFTCIPGFVNLRGFGGWAKPAKPRAHVARSLKERGRPHPPVKAPPKNRAGHALPFSFEVTAKNAKSAKTGERDAPSFKEGGSPHNTGSLAPLDRKTGVPPVREDSASRLSADKTTGWKPVGPDRRDACPPAKRSVLGVPPTSQGTAKRPRRTRLPFLISLTHAPD